MTLKVDFHPNNT